MNPRRLYLDNAATSFPKPAIVGEAMARYATDCGASAGRGAYDEAVAAAGLISQCRSRLQQLFNGEKPEHFIFTHNCTDALNLAIHGMVRPGGRAHVVCTEIDHNSILRPLHFLQSQGWAEITRVRVDPATGLVDLDELRRAIRPETTLLAVTHASNVTGTLQPLRAIGAIARERAVPLLVDAAQSAGHVPIDVQADGVDLLAAPGHKGLLGPLGTGFLYIRPGLERRLVPQRQGGTGSASESPQQPDTLPDKYEAGSHNTIGLVGLSEGVKYVLDRTVAAIAEHEADLIRTFIDGAADIPGLRYFGPQGVRNRVGVFSLRCDGYSPAELSAVLESEFGILSRSGLHCAPLIHEAIGTTADGGATRLSFGPFLSKQDVKFVTDALAHIAASAAAV